MPSPIPKHKHAYLPVMIPASSSSADVRVLWVEPIQEGSLGGLIEPDTIEALLIERPALYALTTGCRPTFLHRLSEPASFDLHTVDVQRNIDTVSASAHSESGTGLTEEPPIERLSEKLWIHVGEVRQLFEEVLRVPVYVYVTEEGAFVVDSILETGRVACVMRKGYAHLMLLMNEEMTDETFEDDGVVVPRVETKLREALNK